MSGYLAGKVWQSDLDGTLKPLAACLADIANDDGTKIYPGIPYLSWLMGKSERAIQYQLKALVEKHILVIVTPPNRPGDYTEYRMEVGQLPKRKKWSDMRSAKGATIAPVRVQKTTEMGATFDTMGANLDICPYKDPSLDPSLTVATLQPRPRLPGSDDERKDNSEQFHYTKLKEPNFFGYDIAAEMAPLFPTLNTKDLLGKWIGKRIVERGIGKRPRSKSTIEEYAQDFQNFLETCVDVRQNGNGHKPPEEYRGPGRDTETPEAKRKRVNCPDCFGTNNQRVPQIIEGKEVMVSKTCQHENSPA